LLRCSAPATVLDRFHWLSIILSTPENVLTVLLMAANLEPNLLERIADSENRRDIGGVSP
jgi:hypothetical protein